MDLALSGVRHSTRRPGDGSAIGLTFFFKDQVNPFRAWGSSSVNCAPQRSSHESVCEYVCHGSHDDIIKPLVTSGFKRGCSLCFRMVYLFCGPGWEAQLFAASTSRAPRSAPLGTWSLWILNVDEEPSLVRPSRWPQNSPSPQATIEVRRVMMAHFARARAQTTLMNLIAKPVLSPLIISMLIQGGTSCGNGNEDVYARVFSNI